MQGPSLILMHKQKKLNSPWVSKFQLSATDKYKYLCLPCLLLSTWQFTPLLTYFEKELNWSCEQFPWTSELERFKTCINSKQYCIFYPLKLSSYFWWPFLAFFMKWTYHHHSHKYTTEFNNLVFSILSFWLHFINKQNYCKTLQVPQKLRFGKSTTIQI